MPVPEERSGFQVRGIAHQMRAVLLLAFHQKMRQFFECLSTLAK